MGMYSGIGSFAKKYNNGGLVVTDPRAGTSRFGSYEEWKTSLDPKVSEGMTEDQLRSLYNAMMQNPFGGGGIRGSGGSNTSTGSTLPSYASVNEDGKIVIPSTITNREFIQLLSTLGYFDNADDYDYDWLLKHFSAGSEAGDGTWLAQKYNTPNSDLDVSAIANMGFTGQNQDVFRRLFEFVNLGSQAGGFVDTTQFGPKTVGLPTGGSPDDGTSNYVPRPLTLGPRPTGGVAGAPYYSLSDVLVTSSEQPNLYDRFDPYPEGGFQVTDPYSGAVTQSSPYPAAPPLPNITPVTTPATTVDGTVGDPTDGTSDTTTADTTTADTTTADTTTADTTTADTTTTDTTTTDINTTTQQTNRSQAQADRYAPDAEGYIRTAGFKDIDPYIYGKRATLQGQKVRQGSRRNLSAQEFMDVLAGQSGTGAYGGDLIYDPDRGIIYSGVSDRMDEARQQAFMSEIEKARNRQSVPFYVDPSLMTDVEEARFRSLTGGSGMAATRVGDTQYFVNDDGTITALDVKDIEYGFSPGFAGGGIVDVYSGDMANLQTTGEGIESFLNPERSKATLRRNLAKLAPRPTAPVMQQGIMPMAR